MDPFWFYKHLIYFKNAQSEYSNVFMIVCFSAIRAAASAWLPACCTVVTSSAKTWTPLSLWSRLSVPFSSPTTSPVSRLAFYSRFLKYCIVWRYSNSVTLLNIPIHCGIIADGRHQRATSGGAWPWSGKGHICRLHAVEHNSCRWSLGPSWPEVRPPVHQAHVCPLVCRLL